MGNYRINGTFRENKDELWPLPQTELNTNKLIQKNNPGY